MLVHLCRTVCHTLLLYQPRSRLLKYPMSSLRGSLVRARNFMLFQKVAWKSRLKTVRLISSAGMGFMTGCSLCLALTLSLVDPAVPAIGPLLYRSGQTARKLFLPFYCGSSFRNRGQLRHFRHFFRICFRSSARLLI